MIHPVRAVGSGSAGMYCAWIRAACCRTGGGPRWLRAYIPKFYLARNEIPKAFQSKPEVLPPKPNRLSQPLAEQLSTPLIWGSTRQWQPWPVTPPLVDRVDSWWPSDHWPAVEPKIVIEEVPSPPPPEIVWWREMGGLLDMWV